MKAHQSLIIIVIVSMISVKAHIGGGKLLLQDLNPQVYCGRNLARILAAICYDDGNFNKRSGIGNMYSSILAPYYKEQEPQIGWPWISPHKARGLSLPGRGKRSVVDECCEKACSVEELLSYC